MIPQKQLKRAIGLLFQAHRRQIILSSRASDNLLGCHRHGLPWDFIPGVSRSKAVQFDLPIGEPKRLVRLHALAGSRPGSPYCLSYCLATADRLSGQPGSQARSHGGTPGISTDSLGVTGCQGVLVAHWGRKPNAPISGYALLLVEFAVTNIPRLYTRAQRTNSYDGELGSSMTCARCTYVLGSFSNPPLSLIITYHYNHTPLYFLGRGAGRVSASAQKSPSSVLAVH